MPLGPPIGPPIGPPMRPPNWAEFDRTGNETSGSFSSVSYQGNNAPCAYDGALVWTAGATFSLREAGATFSLREFWLANFTTTPAAQNALNTAATSPAVPHFTNAVIPTALVYEPATQRIWMTDAGNARLLRIDTVNMVADAAVPLVFDGENYTPSGLIAVGGKLYATATFHFAFGDEDGRLFEVDPVALAITRVSGGPSIGAANGADYDPTGRRFVVAVGSSPEFTTGAIFMVDRGTFVATQLALTAFPSPAPAFRGFSYLSILYGSLWVSSQEIQALFCFDLSGNPLRYFVPNPSEFTAAGAVVSDGQGFLWFADGKTSIHLLNPNDPGPLMEDAMAVEAPAVAGLYLREGSAPALVP